MCWCGGMSTTRCWVFGSLLVGGEKRTSVVVWVQQEVGNLVVCLLGEKGVLRLVLW